MGSPPWFIKHRPVRFTELCFSDETHFEVLEWLRDFQKGSVLHITGGCGTGKTSLVHSVAKALRYNVVEYADTKVEHVGQLNFAKTLDNAPNLLLIDEGDAPSMGLLHRLRSLDLPVVITSTSLLLKDFTVLRVGKPNSEQILAAVKSILRKEGLSLDSRIVLRLSETCNFDFRAVINYCQLFSTGHEIKNLKTIERISSTNIFAACKSVLGRRMRLLELESLYSPRVPALCLASIMEGGSAGGLRCFEALSEVSALPEGYQFLVLDPLNRVRNEFVYKKEETVEVSNRHGHEDPANFLPLYKRDLRNRASVLHLQKIFELYKIEGLSDLDREIKEFVDFTSIERKTFRYRFNPGSSSAVRRDTTVKEIMEI